MTTLEIIKMLSEYYGKELNKTQVSVYMKTLNDIDPELLNMAAEHLIKTGHPFMPKVSELRIAARGLTREWKSNDVLKLIPGAAQTEEDLDERYGTVQEHKKICEVFTSGGELSDRQQAILAVGARS